MSFTPRYKKYSQSEFKRAVVFSTVLQSNFPRCPARMSHRLCWSMARYKKSYATLCNGIEYATPNLYVH